MKCENQLSKNVQLFLKAVIPDCLNPGSMEDPEVVVHGAGYPLPGGYNAVFGFSC
jgi:hypothetical protein